ncbi:MAG: DNA translocase FtsK 4TM domain-containing protein, partial [Candidatus Polarisedimenticolia bacterium]
MRARRRTVSPRRDTPKAYGFLTEATAIVVMAFALLLVLSLASYDDSDPVPWPFGRWEGEPVGNWAGIVGAFLAEFLRQLLGHAAWLVPPLLLFLGFEVFWRRGGRGLSRFAGSILFVLSVAGCLHLLFDAGRGAAPVVQAGGWFGHGFGGALAGLLNRWGGLVGCAAIAGTSLLLVTRTSMLRALRAGAGRIAALAAGVWRAWVRHRESRRREMQRLEVVRRQRERQA